MNEARTLSAEDVFAEALALPTGERRAFVVRRCAGAVREEVLSLLGHHETAGAGFLGPAGVGARVGGRYRLVRMLGQGGFGSVYLAEQEEPVRRLVALKLLHAGMGAAGVVARFEAERQALAVMEHPGIARVFDAGTTDPPDGRPYFAMEYVAGEPIAAYCAGHGLGLRERLGLFVQVCGAVQHAHAKGIIHRDIKSSNVLVEEPVAGPGETRTGPRVRVIDFGIAKATQGALTERTLVTEQGRLMGTPEYMSPEQARGLDIDTRADVYSLGVLLYELLTGTLPFGARELRGKTPGEIERVIREVEPERPSARVERRTAGRSAGGADGAESPTGAPARVLRGDLDWIVMKCLEKDRERRYPTAADVGADVERYLRHEPVAASPPSRAYRVRKFARRNRVALGVLATVVLALAVGLGLAGYGLMKAARERDEIARRNEVLQGVVGYIDKDFLRLADPRATRGRDVTIKEMLTEAAAGLDGKGVPNRDQARLGAPFDDPLVEAAIRATIGEMERRLGRLEAAAPQLEKAIAIRREKLGESHPDTLAAVRELGIVYDEGGRNEEAAALFLRVLEERERALGSEDPETVRAMGDLAIAYERCGRYGEAEPLSRRVLGARARALGEENADTLLAMNNLAWLLQVEGKHAEAEPLALRAAEGCGRLLGPDNTETLHVRNTLGVIYLREGRVDEAERVLRETLERRLAVLGADHLDVASSRSNLAECLLAKGGAAEAEGLLRAALEVREKQLPAANWALAGTRSALGEALYRQGRFEEAEGLVVPAGEALVRGAGVPPERRRRAVERVFELYTAWGKPEKGTEWRESVRRLHAVR